MQPFQHSIPQTIPPCPPTGSPEPPFEQWHLCAPDGSVFGPMTANEVELLLAQGAIPKESHVCSSLDGTWVPLPQHFPGRPTETLPQRLLPQLPPVVQISKGVEKKSDETNKEATAEPASPVQIAIGIVALVAIIAVLILNWRSLITLPRLVWVIVYYIPIFLGGWIIRSTYSLFKSHRGGLHERH